MRILVTGAIAAALCGTWANAQSVAQALPADEKLAFDVASVKANKSEDVPHTNVPLGAGTTYSPTGGSFSATNFPLVLYIYFAYNLSGNQMKDVQASLPQWVFTERFDIVARAPSRNPTLDEVRAMLRSLFRDRFKLRAHYETRQGPVLALIRQKDDRLGSSLQQHPTDADCSARPPYAQAKAGTSFPALCGGILPMTPTVAGNVKRGARNVTMEYLASFLGTMGNLDRPVLDRTGLTGTFDFALEWAPEIRAVPGVSSQPDLVDSQPDVRGPSFEVALREQLGLKLESSKGEVRVLLIDHVERPSAN